MLDVSGNQLYSIPQSISRMKQLSVFDISHNKIEVLPNWLGFLKELKVFT